MCFSHMATIETQLEVLHDGKSKKIRGIIVQREGDLYRIGDNEYDLDNAAGVIKESGTSRQKFPYDKVVFLLVKSPSKVISTHQIRNRREHAKLLELAKSKNYYIYYADVQQRNGKFFAVQPWVIDWESVDNIHDLPEQWPKKNLKPKPKCKIVENEDDVIDSLADTEGVEDKAELSCPFCGKKVSSTPGRTLHVKIRHPDRYEEYLANK